MSSMRRGRRAAIAVPLLAGIALGALPAHAELTSTSTSTSTTTTKPAKPPKQGTLWGDDTTLQGVAAAGTGAWSAPADNGSLWAIEEALGVHAAWTKKDAQGRLLTGQGIDVALLDTGVSAVGGLDAPGKVVQGPDLSLEGRPDPTAAGLDGFGHGTHMAGIIAGKDPMTGKTDAKSYADPTQFRGVAPDARLVSLKLAAADGSADVSQIIAAVDWVTQHRKDPGMNVRVLNLSYGTDSVQAAAVDPLAHAVENAWRAGIVVVVSAGNDGLDQPRLTMPAMDPYVIAVGAADNMGTSSIADDRVSSFTNGGSVTRRPDLLAPGKSVVSLRDPGSVVDQQNPQGLVAGDASKRFFRGSGTSQAAAVVSGAVALLLQQRPDLTPDQVKALLTSTADRLATDPSPAQGAGLLNVAKALGKSAPVTRQTWPISTGLGSLEASRGSLHVSDPTTGSQLSGEQDIAGRPWDPTAWASASAAGTSWSGSSWNGAPWYDRVWTGQAWAGAHWAGAYWAGAYWAGAYWAGASWAGAYWAGAYWAGAYWAGASWAGASWAGAYWAAGTWL